MPDAGDAVDGEAVPVELRRRVAREEVPRDAVEPREGGDVRDFVLGVRQAFGDRGGSNPEDDGDEDERSLAHAFPPMDRAGTRTSLCPRNRTVRGGTVQRFGAAPSRALSP